MSFENEQYVSSRIDKIEALEQEIARLKQQLESCQNELLGVAEQLDIAEAVLSVQVTASALAYFKDKQDEEK